MAPPSPPKQFQIDLSLFPKDAAWAKPMVDALNQFAQQTVAFAQALNPPPSAITFKTINFLTDATVSSSFPLDFPVDTAPKEVRVALINLGTQDISKPITPQWTIVNTTSKTFVRITGITGLASNTRYQMQLALQ